MIAILCLFVFILASTSLAFWEKIQLQQRKLNDIGQRFNRYEEIDSLYEYAERLHQHIEESESKISEQRSYIETLHDKRESLCIELDLLENKLLMRECQIEEYEYKYSTFDGYREPIRKNSEQQLALIKDKRAISCRAPWLLEMHKRTKNKIISYLNRVLTSSFNHECSKSISSATIEKLASRSEKIRSKFKSFNKKNSILDCQLSENYLNLKLEELRLKCEQSVLDSVEKERRAEEKRKEQEEKKQRKKAEEADAERERAVLKQQKIHEEQARIRVLIDEARREAQETKEREINKLVAQNENLQKQLEEAQLEEESAINRSRRYKKGYIYVVSNVGTFKSENIYRICKTTRDDPDNYIRAMNPSVPFYFDVHLKIESADCALTLSQLHERFRNNRINPLNSWKEDFFEVNLDEIFEAVYKICAEEDGIATILEEEKIAKAYEFRELQRQRRQS